MFGISKLFGPKTDFRQLKQKGAIILDVRTAAEYKTGHIPGSVNIAVDEVGTVLADLKRKNKPIITCCRSGVRSGRAADILKNAGIEVYNGGSWDGLLKQLS